jgi:UDP-galactopyranose mutase
MAKIYDYLVVGSGLTGAVIARKLHDAGLSVLVIDRRSHIGGNVHDYIHESGVRIHTYGPHYFRTSSDEIWTFINRFANFFEYQPALKTYIDGLEEDWPVTLEYMQRILGERWLPAFQGTPKNFEEASLKIMPQIIYEKFVYGYSKKQWGIEPKNLDASLATRFEVRMNSDRRLKNSKYQGIPSEGYANMMKNLLDGIEVLLETDFHKSMPDIQVTKKTIYTGPIDEFFNNCLGKLQYRGQKREHTWYTDRTWIQSCGQVNNPQIENGTHVRTLEWKHMMPKASLNSVIGTVLTTETPFTPEDGNSYEYPFPSEHNQKLYSQYEFFTRKLPNVLICGRLGEYKYYDMDQAIGRAFVLSKKILEEHNTRPINNTIEKTLNIAREIEIALAESSTIETKDINYTEQIQSHTKDS